SKISFLAIMAAAISCTVLSFFYPHANTILFSLFVGELVTITGLVVICNRHHLFYPRLLFILKNLPLLIIPIGCRIIFGDNGYSFLVSLSIYGILFLAMNWKLFILHKHEKEISLYES